MTISNDEAVKLFLKMNKGYSLSNKERRLLSMVKELDLSFIQITSLKGLCALTNLRSLDLSKTQVSSLEGLSGLSNLQSLNLANTLVISLKGISRLTNLQSLDLRGTLVNYLKGLSGLTNLQSLKLENTPVSSLEELSGLTNLRSLGLRGTQVSSLKGLSELTNLQSLDLENTPISSLEGLNGLTSLQSLNLSWCLRVSSLEGLSGSTSLRSLNLAWCSQVSSLEGLNGLINLRSLKLCRCSRVSSLEGLSGLPNLRSLDLRGTQISSLKGLSELTNLQSLDLQDTRVTSLKELESLVRLTNLYISGVSIDRIPKRLVDNNLPFYTNRKHGDEPGVYMKDVQLSEQSLSLFFQSRELIEAYYKEEEEERVPVNEAKVIFLGDGGVGKTYTIYRIEHEGKEPEKSTETTPGVSITQYKRDDKATINFWDFGGQEIMHSMHRCFLTERTCYVVTVSNRWTEVTRQARRWLKNIESFAPNSKVVLAVNRWEGVSVWDLDKGRLKKEFPNLLDFVEYDARDSNGISELKKSIEQEVDKLPSVNEEFPKSWMEIMEKLRNMTDDSGKPLNYITKEQYQIICKNAKLKDVDKDSVTLLGWFNDLGVSFSYYKDAKDGSELNNYMILKPEWLTNAVYVIVNNGKDHAPRGHITRAGLLTILNNPEKCVVKDLGYNQDELRYLLEVMRKFRLSFQVGDDQEFVPALCPNKTPDDLRPKDYVLHVRCEVRYDYLPDSVVHRLMCDCSDKLDFKKCWLKGLCIDDIDPFGLFAVCDMGKDDDVLYIDVYQVAKDGNLPPQTPQYLLRSLLNKIERINNESNLKSTIWICSDDGKAAFQLSTLSSALKQGKSCVPYTDDGEYTEYDIQKLLGQVFDKSFKEEISKSDEKEILTQNPFLTNQSSEKAIEAVVLNYYNVHNGDKIENSNVADRGGTAYNQGVMTKAEEGARVDNSFNSTSELSRQLEEFRNVLNKLSALTPDQKEDLSDAVGDLIDNLGESEEKQSKWKERFKKTVKRVGEFAYSTIENAAGAVVANYLQGYFPRS